jgi:hypothetical protein
MQFDIRDPVYGRIYCVYIGNRNECIKKIDKRFHLSKSLGSKIPEGSAGLALEVESKDEEFISILWSSDININYITHECMHLCYMTLHRAGIDLSDDTNETYAYYLGFLVRDIVDNINKRITKCAKK